LREVGLDLETEDLLVKATREYLPGDLREQVRPSLAESVEKVESAFFSAQIRPFFDKERMAAMGRPELLDYLSRGVWLFYANESPLTKRFGIVNRFFERFEREGLDAALAQLEAYACVPVPTECDSYPGLVVIWKGMGMAAAGFREGIRGLGSVLREVSSRDAGLCLAIVHLIAQDFPKAFETLESWLRSLDLDAEASGITILLTFLLAAEQTAYVRRLFEDEAFATYKFKDRFKPHYFALLAQLGESRADDFKRMGQELAQTVDEIRANVVEWRKAMNGAPGLSRP
jgi:hypothetical protein